MSTGFSDSTSVYIEKLRGDIAKLQSAIAKHAQEKPISFSTSDAYILWAAMCAMVDDVHSPQDQLNTSQRDRAVEIFKELDRIVNEADGDDTSPVGAAFAPMSGLLQDVD